MVQDKNLDEEDPLRLQLQTHPMFLVVQEVLQPKELDSAERPPVPPEHRYFQLPRLKHKPNLYIKVPIQPLRVSSHSGSLTELSF